MAQDRPAANGLSAALFLLTLPHLFIKCVAKGEDQEREWKNHGQSFLLRELKKKKQHTGEKKKKE